VSADPAAVASSRPLGAAMFGWGASVAQARKRRKTGNEIEYGKLRRIRSVYMSARLRVFSSSVGSKILIGVTGLALFLYLILHIAGNLMVFLGPRVFNEYSHTLLSNPLIYPVEIGLLLRSEEHTS